MLGHSGSAGHGIEYVLVFERFLAPMMLKGHSTPHEVRKPGTTRLPGSLSLVVLPDAPGQRLLLRATASVTRQAMLNFERCSGSYP
jgi:hypothetical protein